MNRACRWLCLIGGLACVSTAVAQSVTPIPRNAYQNNLDRLNALTAACARALSSATPLQACDPSTIGPDQTVAFLSGQRRVGYDWLRDALRQAAAAAQDRKQNPNALKPAATALQTCTARLEQMIRQAASPETGVYVPDKVANMRSRLSAILESGEYPQPREPSLLERIWRAILRWLLNALVSAMPRGSSTFTLYFLEFAVIALPCGLLVWWFVRRLRLQKLDLPQDSVLPPSAQPAQDWQQWLSESERLAGEGRWREAIHHVYWAAISCLETRRVWTADRARTPREYLRLVNRNTDIRASLFSLTRSFEHTWYGETPASENDFLEARNVLKRITAP